jgi:hypothetical protein
MICLRCDLFFKINLKINNQEAYFSNFNYILNKFLTILCYAKQYLNKTLKEETIFNKNWKKETLTQKL